MNINSEILMGHCESKTKQGVGWRSNSDFSEFANVRFILSMVTGEPSHEQNMC